MSSELVLRCQKYVIENGGEFYPYYLGALDAKELLSISEAPSFQENTPNTQIAAEVLNPPTQHWQRPIQNAKVEAIAERFDREREIMPNPVLLAVNPSRRISVSEDSNGHGNPTGLWTIRIEVSDSGIKPLWIIDGQHRVTGLSKTRLSKSPLPFVLLYSDSNVYMPAVLAKIFAQVTTEATALNPIHQSWMQFVFNLGPYADMQPAWRSMKTTAILCSTQEFENKPNPFYDKIGFNPELEPRQINPGGFSFDAKYLQDLLKDRYFKSQGGMHQLTENDVAEQIGLAVHALKSVVTRETDRSAFFGGQRSEQKYFRDGFISGVCAYLKENGKARDWLQVLKDLNFDHTDWDVSGWVNSTSGRAGTISKKLAFDCFDSVFQSGSMPENVDNICELLQGALSFLQIEYKLVDEEGNPVRNSGGKIKLELPGGIEKRSENIPLNARYIKITSPSKNAGPVSISLKEKPFDDQYSFSEFKKGKVFQSNELKALKNKIVLNIKVDFYGDVTIRKELTLNVRD